MKRLIICIGILAISILSSISTADIPLRRTIEEYEGLTLPNMDWNADIGGDASARPFHESDNEY